ncbi:MAG: hypothetical protein ACOC2Q_02950 [Spirochaetota bacterium]
MSPRDRIASHILAAYGELGFRLAAAMVTNAAAVEALVTGAASSCDDPADWLGFLSRVRERATLWAEAHPEDAPHPHDTAFRTSSPAALDFSGLPVDALSVHEAASKLADEDRELLFEVLLGRVYHLDRGELETRLARVLQSLRTRVREGNFPAAEDIP